MIQAMTKLKILDNSGAKLARVIRVLGGNKHKPGNLGSHIIVNIKKISGERSKIKRGDISKLKVLKSGVRILRKDGTELLFDKSGGILLINVYSPLGSRIKGPLPRELKNKFYKIISLHKFII
jgi:large subunit ribosomal protein L14